MRIPWVLLCAATLVLALTHSARAQQDSTSPADPNFAHPNLIVTAQRDGYTISALVTHLEGARTFLHGIALFPGHPGILRLRQEDGAIRFDLRGNFLVRSRRHWLDAQTLVLVLDAPSDQQATFTQHFRETPRYGADVAALIAETGKHYSVGEWTFVGTSEGSVSAFHAARMNAALARRTILTSSLFRPSRNGPGLSGVTWTGFAPDLLWVHHESDPCEFTAYRDAQAFARTTSKPLVTVRGGGPGRGGACQAYTAHGFAGLERETVLAMRAWITTGTVPADVGR